jgi:hypothetical protein
MIRQTAKTPNNAPTISIGVIRHLGSFQLQPFHFAVGGTIPNQSRGRLVIAMIIAPLASPWDE